jgi:hypothetical protein
MVNAVLPTISSGCLRSSWPVEQQPDRHTVRYFHRELKKGHPPVLISASWDPFLALFDGRAKGKALTLATTGPIKGVDKNSLIYL